MQKNTGHGYRTKVPWHVFGHGLGGAVAMTLAIEYPQMVHSLTVSGWEASFRYDSWARQLFAWSGAQAYLAKMMGPEYVAKTVSDAMQLKPTGRRLMREMVLRCHPIHRRRAAFTWLAFDETARLHLIRPPGGFIYIQPEFDALALHGRERKERDVAVMRAANPDLNATIVDVENATHMLPYEQPGVVAKIMLDSWVGDPIDGMPKEKRKYNRMPDEVAKENKAKAEAAAAAAAAAAEAAAAAAAAAEAKAAEAEQPKAAEEAPKQQQ